MNPSAKLSELMETLEFESEESVTRFDRQTGRIVSVDRHILSAFEEGEADELGELPDWQEEQLEIAKAMAGDDGERFIAVPDKFDFHEYRHMERFIGTVESTPAAEELWRAIKGKGAFLFFQGHREPAGTAGPVVSVSRRSREGARHGLGRGQPGDSRG
jgi:hypothetical protein